MAGVNGEYTGITYSGMNAPWEFGSWVSGSEPVGGIELNILDNSDMDFTDILMRSISPCNPAYTGSTVQIYDSAWALLVTMQDVGSGGMCLSASRGGVLGYIEDETYYVVITPL